MKLNRKGFLLAETIVTVCIIATLATSMYLYISKTSSRFEDRNNYENVTDVYKVNTLKDYLSLKDMFTTRGDITNSLGQIKTELSIKGAYLIQKTEDYNNLINTSNQALKDYLNWINIDSESEDLRLIVWFEGNNGEDGTFANLKIVK